MTDDLYARPLHSRVPPVVEAASSTWCRIRDLAGQGIFSLCGVFTREVHQVPLVCNVPLFVPSGIFPQSRPLSRDPPVRR